MIYNRQSGGSIAELKNVEEIAKKSSAERSGKSSDSAPERGNTIIVKGLTQVSVQKGKLKAG